MTTIMCDLCFDEKCPFRGKNVDEQSCFLFQAKAMEAEITFAPEDIQFGQTSKKKTRNKHQVILVEKDILNPQRDVKYLDNKRAKVRTRLGLFCCIANRPMKFKVIKVIPTKSSHKRIKDVQSYANTAGGESYDKVLSTEQSPDSDWNREVKEIFEEDRPAQTMRVIPMKTFIRQVRRALKKQELAA